LSIMADEKAATGRLADAMRLVDRADHGRPAPEWAAFHGHAELEYAQGLLYTELGHHHAATQYLRAALTHQERTYGRNMALYRLTLAHGLVQAGEADEAAAHAVESLEHLEEVESGRVMRRLVDVSAALREVGAISARGAAEELTEYVRTKEAA
jgi:uncharacterized protein HemY